MGKKENDQQWLIHPNLSNLGHDASLPGLYCFFWKLFCIFLEAILHRHQCFLENTLNPFAFGISVFRDGFFAVSFVHIDRHSNVQVLFVYFIRSDSYTILRLIFLHCNNINRKMYLKEKVQL